ncbi:vir-repressed protein [Janthinobacterium sp. 17J80-10]|uniref:vir-repressed protein n=1 Tax=Janthinobacterium sp. 17J80-10 TaxID=2497863 RepID=UPI00100564FC|nr:vir-repressed protein [Janthinobacterium sp. 17J80-10]QAU34784.1 vir-repressed protein [Janthinobacterium sp. 17J80-10]
MKILIVLLVMASSFLSGCATQREPTLHPYGVKAKPGGEGYCPPTQAIKGLC